MHPCARCATIQRTCCQRAEILVTLGDVARIAAHTGREDFWRRARPTDPGYLDQDDDPNWLTYTLDDAGTRRVLHRSDEHGCTFLGTAGCVLPLEVRPLVCRLYPFSYTERGLDAAEDPDYCPTEVLAPPGSGLTMLTVLGMARADGERWRASLYDELRAEHQTRQPNAEAGAGAEGRGARP